MPAQRRHSLDHRVHVDADDEPFRRSGAGRWLVVLGVALSLAGCAVWAYVLVREIGVADDSRDVVPGVSAPVVGFVAMVLGFVLASIGAGHTRSERPNPFD